MLTLSHQSSESAVFGFCRLFGPSSHATVTAPLLSPPPDCPLEIPLADMDMCQKDKEKERREIRDNTQPPWRTCLLGPSFYGFLP